MTAIMSADSIGICYASTSLFTHNMLQIAHLVFLQIVGSVLIHLECAIGTVSSLPLTFHAYGS